MKTTRGRVVITAALAALSLAVVSPPAAHAEEVSPGALGGDATPLALGTRYTSPTRAGYFVVTTPNVLTASFAIPQFPCASAHTAFAGSVTANNRNQAGGFRAGIVMECLNRQRKYIVNFLIGTTRSTATKPAAPGELIDVTISRTNSSFRMTIANRNRGWSLTKTGSTSIPDQVFAGLETVVDVSHDDRPIPLTNFGTFKFSSARVNNANFGSYTAFPFDLVTNNVLRAKTANIANGSGDFTVAWKHA